LLGLIIVNQSLFISWKIINDPSWPGGRVGNKIFPDKPGLSTNVPLKNPRPKVYELKTGFFTSTRPGLGDGWLLLNINATTSAFFPQLNLQEWLKRRFNLNGRFIPDARDLDRNELKDVKVVFECDNKKARSICEISYVSILQQKFKKNDGTETSVFDHMKKSGFRLYCKGFILI
jgi:hypothetical protein